MPDSSSALVLLFVSVLSPRGGVGARMDTTQDEMLGLGLGVGRGRKKERLLVDL